VYKRQGKGWIEFDLKATNVATLIKGQFISNSASWGTAVTPTAGQVLTYDATANGGTGGYVPKTPGATAVYSVANDLAALNSSGTMTADLVAGLTNAGSITAKADLHPGDTVVVTDSGNADASTNVGPGSYIYDGTNFVALPSGGGASNLGDLLNVNITPTAVTAANQTGFLVRDSSVATETNAGAYKISTALDCGTY